MFTRLLSSSYKYPPMPTDIYLLWLINYCRWRSIHITTPRKGGEMLLIHQCTYVQHQRGIHEGASGDLLVKAIGVTFLCPNLYNHTTFSQIYCRGPVPLRNSRQLFCKILSVRAWASVWILPPTLFLASNSITWWKNDGRRIRMKFHSVLRLLQFVNILSFLVPN